MESIDDKLKRVQDDTHRAAKESLAHLDEHIKQLAEDWAKRIRKRGQANG